MWGLYAMTMPSLLVRLSSVNLLSRSLHGSTCQQAGAYRIVSGTLVIAISGLVEIAYFMLEALR